MHSWPQLFDYLFETECPFEVTDLGESLVTLFKWYLPIESIRKFLRLVHCTDHPCVCHQKVSVSSFEHFLLGGNGRLDTSNHVVVLSIQIPSFNMPLCLVGNKPFIFMTQYIRYSSDPDKCDTLQSHAPMIKTKVAANRLKRKIKAPKQMNRWITMHRRARRYEECVKALFRQFSWAKGGWQIRKASKDPLQREIQLTRKFYCTSNQSVNDITLQLSFVNWFNP